MKACPQKALTQDLAPKGKCQDPSRKNLGNLSNAGGATGGSTVTVLSKKVSDMTGQGTQPATTGQLGGTNMVVPMTFSATWIIFRLVWGAVVVLRIEPARTCKGDVQIQHAGDGVWCRWLDACLHTVS